MAPEDERSNQKESHQTSTITNNNQQIDENSQKINAKTIPAPKARKKKRRLHKKVEKFRKPTEKENGKGANGPMPQIMFATSSQNEKCSSLCSKKTKISGNSGIPEKIMEEEVLRIQELLLSENGCFDISCFKKRYADKFGKKYNCPSKKKCEKLSSCLQLHFGGIFSFVNEGSSVFLKFSGKNSLDTTGSNNGQPVGTASGAHKAAETPVAAAAKTKKKLVWKPIILDQHVRSRNPSRDTPIGLNYDDFPSISLNEESKQKSKLDNSKKAKQQGNNVIPISLNSEFDTVRMSPKRAPVFQFKLDDVHKGGLPTKADVNNRVNAVRTNMSKGGFSVDMFTLTKKLCEYYGVRSVQELKCTDQLRGFEKDIHIDALSEFSKVYCKILCTIHSYCTCSTIATLYDLDKHICEKENKDSFLDLKIGPLQKIPLVYEHFKFPCDMDIKKLSTTDVMQNLWKFCGQHARGKKVDMEKFLEYLAQKCGFVNPYDMGLKINSIALAIQVVKRVKFGDMDQMKNAEKDLLLNMEQDLEDYIRKIRRGITGRNTRALPGQPENIVQQIAGMYIEDAIMEIFQHANNCTKGFKTKFSRLPGMLTSIQRVIETMAFFRSKPTWSKIFHVVVATGIFRQLGLDDEALLTALGFKDALKKMTDERMMEICPESAAAGLGKGSKRKYQVFKEGQVKKELQNWLEKCSKPIDLASLSNIEQGVATAFDVEAIGFECIRQETFLGFLNRNKELHKYLGASVVVDSSSLNKIDERNDSKKKVEEFIYQCGESKEKEDILSSVKKQFPEVLCKQLGIEGMISNGLDGSQTPPSCSVKYIYALMCGSELSRNICVNEASGNDHGCLGSFSHEEVMLCLESAPLFEDLARWSNWKLVFEPSFGDLKTFLRKQDKVNVIETAANVFLKVDLDSTTDHLKTALDNQNARETVGCLLSIICANGGLCETPLIHLANIVKSSLAIKLDADVNSDANLECIERFVLQCLMLLPVEFCSSIANKIFLSPLCEILGDGQDTESIPSRILAACKTASERSYLHSLGAMLAVHEWTTDFREHCFVKRNDFRKKEQTSERLEKNVAIGTSQGKSHPRTANAESSPHDEVVSVKSINDSTDESESKETCSDHQTDLSSDKESSIGDEAYVDETLLEEIKSRMQHCQDLINEIRRDEFGKGEELGEKEAILLKRNNERLCRSLDRLSKELYTKDAHFVLELIQNADDNRYDENLYAEDSQEYPSVAFIVDQNCVTVLNNECGFQDKDIRAICDVGKSTKGAHRKGYIGQKGIGFKSVFKMTDCPEIHSNDFHICFDASEDPMGYILPEWIENEKFDDLTEYSPPGNDIDVNWMTQINLPLKKNMIDPKSLSARFQDIHPSLLLFLNRLKTVIVDNRINEKCLVMKKRTRGQNMVELTQNGIPSLWFVVSTEIDIHARGELETTEVSLAFPLDDASMSDQKSKALPTQSVFAFLPLRSYGFKFLIQADFEVPSSREDINRDSAWNQSILQDIPRLVVDAFFRFRDGKSLDMLTDPLYAATRLFQFLPLESEILGVFKPIARKILQLLQKECCIPVVTGETMEEVGAERETSWTIPSEVILGDSTLRKIITPTELQRYLNLNYMCSVMQENVSPALLTALGVQSENLDHLLEISKSHLRVITEQKGKAQATVQWIGKWLLCISEYLERNYDSSQESRQKIRSATVFPLSNGELVNMIDAALFFPFANKASKSKNARQSISKLEQDLNTIDNNVFQGLDDIEQLKVTRLLSDLGVKHVSPKLVIENHIIPAFKKGKWKEHLLNSYLIYVKEQYSADQAAVDIEDLKTCVILNTSNGHVNPSETKVYFSEKFGNEINLKEMFSSYNWTLIDSMYLQNSSSSDVKSWEKFLTKLGVSHFPKMVRKTVRLDQNELSESLWSNLAQNWPSTKNGIYDIEDYMCEEIDAIMQSNDPKQTCSLALQLDKRWKSNFSHIQNDAVPVRDSNGNNIAMTYCSLIIKLKTTRWLPGKTASTQQLELFKPGDLYLPQQGIKAIFSDFCSYFLENLNEMSFIDAIGIQHMVTIEELFRQLGSWSRNSDFMTSLSHMTNVYHFIKSHSTEIDRTEFDKPIIFVPEESEKHAHEDNEIVRGSFCVKTQVCLYDHSTISVRYRSLFPNRRRLLFQFYPKDILDFFEAVVKVDSAPNVCEYVNMACILADDIKLPDANRVGDLMMVFATLGEKCLIDNDRDEHIIHSECNLSSFYAVAKDCLDRKMTNFVYWNIKDEQIFPTINGRFVTLKERPLLVDNEHQMEIFGESDLVFFLDLPPYLKDWIRGERLLRDGSRRFDLRKQMKGILDFFSICNIEFLSSVVCPVEIIPENSVNGCYQWQEDFCSLLPFIQRYLHYREKRLYDALVKQNINKRLEEIKFFTVNSLTALHTIRGNENVLVKKRRKVALEELEEGTYFHVARDFLNEKEDIIAEFLKLFIKNKKDIEEKLSDLLLLLSSEKDPKKNEKHLIKKGIKILPEDERQWKIPYPIKPTPVKKAPVVPKQDNEQDSGGAITCWPPPRPSADPNTDKLKPQNGFQQMELSQWPVPAPPEVMPLDGEAILPLSRPERGREEGEPTSLVDNVLVKRQLSNSGTKEQEQRWMNKVEARKDGALGGSEMTVRTMDKYSINSDNNISTDKVIGSVKEKAPPTLHEAEPRGLMAQQSIPGPQQDAQATQVVSKETAVSVQPALASSETKQPKGEIPSSNGLLTTQELPKTLQCAYENVEHSKIGEEVQKIWMNLNNDSAESDIVGRMGEMVVYNELRRVYMSHDDTTVKWLNEKTESQSPCDIVIERNLGNGAKEHRYIEVKATKASSDKPFEISSHELKFAFENADHYDIYRISGITDNLDNVVIKRLLGLPKYMDEKVVKVFIVL